MEHDIANALAGVISEERIDQFVDILEQLKALNFDAHLDELIQVLALGEDNCDPGLLVDRINDVLTKAVLMVLESCGVRAIIAPIVEYQPLLEALLDWETYIFPRVLRELLDQGMNANESFALIVEEITLTDADFVLDVLQSVDMQVIMRMKTILDDKLLDELPEANSNRSLRTELVTYIKELSIPPLICELAKNGYNFGTQMDVLLSGVLDKLDRCEVHRRGIELYLIKLYSKDQRPLIDVLTDYTDSTQERILMNAAITGFIDHA